MIRTKITKQRKNLRWVLCFVVACFLFSVEMSAQQYPDLVSESDALTMLSSELPILENTMNNATPGSSAYVLAERTWNMYMHTWEILTSGKDVEEALTSSFGEFSRSTNGSPMSEDELPPMTKDTYDYGDSVFNSLVNFLEI